MSAPLRIPESGETLGPYLVLQPVTPRPASSQSPCVYRALDRGSLGEVALTLFPFSAEHQQYWNEGLKRYQRITSPFLLPARGGGVQDGWFYLVTDWVPSVSLRTILQAGGGLNLDSAGRILWSVATALETLHSQGLVHGNLQPDNVRVRPSGEIRVVGFVPPPYGYPQPSHHAEESILRYAPPEWLSQRRYTKESDLYSFGLLAYEIFTGKVLLSAGTVKETLTKQAQIQKVLDKVNQLTRTIPPSMDLVVRSMLDADAAKRAGMAARMLDEVKKLAPGSLTGAPLPQRLGRRFVTSVELAREQLLESATGCLEAEDQEPLAAASFLARAADLPRSQGSQDDQILAREIRRCLWFSFRFPPPEGGERDELQEIAEALCYLLTKAARRLGSKTLAFATERRLLVFASAEHRQALGLRAPASGELREETDKLLRWIAANPGDEHALATLAALSDDFQPALEASVSEMQASLLRSHGLYPAALYYRARDLIVPELAPAVMRDLAELLQQAQGDGSAGPAAPAPATSPVAEPEEPVPDTVSGIFDGELGDVEVETSPPSLVGYEEEAADSLLETIMSASAEISGSND